MAQYHLPAGPSVPKPAHSPQGPGVTHAHLMSQKPRGLRLRARNPTWPANSRLAFPIPHHPPQPPPRGGNDRPTQASPGPPSPQWAMKSLPARLPSRTLGITRLSPRYERRGATPLVTFAGAMAATPARPLSRASGASHRTPRSILPIHLNPTTSPPPPRPSPVLPPRLVLNRSAHRRWNPDQRPPSRNAGRRAPGAPLLPIVSCHYPLTLWPTQPAHLHGAVARHL